MLLKLFSLPGKTQRHGDELRELQRERHFESLMMQSWTDMRARGGRRPR